jgi:ribose 5-phosphate isomerase A
VTDADAEKRAAARAAAEFVEDGMFVGLGTGSTVAHLLPAIAERELSIRCVSTSVATEDQARELGIRVEPFEGVARLDLAIDGADQIAPDGWLVKGGGGAHVREKIVAAAADRFVVIADSSKPVERIVAPIPLELLRYGLDATLGHLADTDLRDVPPSPDDGLIADYRGEVSDPAELAARLAAVPGVVGHGLFEPRLTATILVARGDEVERRDL